MSYRSELEGNILLNGDKPHVVTINESFLNRAVEEVSLSGYELVSRRDRRDESGFGGVLVFALTDFAPHIVLLEHGESYEASWHAVHSDIGPVLLCAWYRPPASGEIVSIRAFIADWERLSTRYIGTIVLGDLNAHHKRWLKHSSHNSVEGSSLYTFCCDNGFKQLVREPTREDHLLDLVLTDMDEAIGATVLPKIADHNVVRAQFALQVASIAPLSREVFLFKSADWRGMRNHFLSRNWAWIEELCVDDSCERLSREIIDGIRLFVPTRFLYEKIATHPWLNQRCVDAIEKKRKAEGVADFTSAAEKCSDILFEEFFAYNRRIRDRLSKLKRGSKEWWRLSKHIADRKTTTSGIPALKRHGEWALEPTQKANVLAETFASKSFLR